MHLDALNRLVDQNGNQMLGQNGPIEVPAGTAGVEIDATGTVRSAPAADRAGRYDDTRRVLGQLRLDSVPAGTPLTHEGNTYFLPPATSSQVPNAMRDIRQGYVEDSNVAPTDAIVEMITIQRNFALAQKAITTLDETRGKAVNDLGRPA
jgi:flagellar basal body rod protein FlgG